MKTKKNVQKYLTKGIRKIKNRKGFGVHSPFAYSLITQVIGEQASYYAYEDIFRIKKVFSKKILPDFIAKRQPSTKLLFLLYRLINRFNSKNILEVDNHGGLVSSVLTMVHADSNLLTVSANSENLQQTQDLFKKQNLPIQQLTTVCGPIIDSVNNLSTGQKFDFIFVHTSACKEGVKLYEVLNRLTHNDSVIVVEGIHSNQDASILWDLFKNAEDVRVSMDLYELGIAIYHERLFKQHYVVSF